LSRNEERASHVGEESPAARPSLLAPVPELGLSGRFARRHLGLRLIDTTVTGQTRHDSLDSKRADDHSARNDVLFLHSYRRALDVHARAAAVGRFPHHNGRAMHSRGMLPRRSNQCQTWTDANHAFSQLELHGELADLGRHHHPGRGRRDRRPQTQGAELDYFPDDRFGLDLQRRVLALCRLGRADVQPDRHGGGPGAVDARLRDRRARAT